MRNPSRYFNSSPEVIRDLIECIELEPLTLDGQEIIAVNLQGKLAGILSLATNAKRPLDESDLSVECTKLVAGESNRRYQQGLFQAAA